MHSFQNKISFGEKRKRGGDEKHKISVYSIRQPYTVVITVKVDVS